MILEGKIIHAIYTMVFILYHYMVAHFTLRTYVVNQKFRFVEGIWLHRQSRQVPFIFRKLPILHHMCETCTELPSYISTMMYDGPFSMFGRVNI